MLTILSSLLIMIVIVVIMSIGVIMGRKPIQGSCGGLNRLKGLDDCELCGGSRAKCESINSKSSD